MPFDANSAWLGGGSMLALVIYFLFSAFISGPEILARESKMKADWPNQCMAMVVAELEVSRPQPDIVPQIDYRAVARQWLGRDADPLLQLMAPLGQAMDQANAQAERAKRLNEERLQRKVEAAGSRCGCAVSMLSEEQRISLGLYAGSGRLVTPPIFKNLNDSLVTALNGPRCSGDHTN